MKSLYTRLISVPFFQSPSRLPEESVCFFHILLPRQSQQSGESPPCTEYDYEAESVRRFVYVKRQKIGTCI